MKVPQVTAAGEYFVAHKIFCLGYVALLVRQGYPMIDIIASTENGEKTVGVQVKTTSNTKRYKGKKGHKILGELQFPIGYKAVEIKSKIIYCFVDLADGENVAPDVYVIPQHFLAKFYDGWNVRQHTFFRFHQKPEALNDFKNNWNPIIEALS